MGSALIGCHWGTRWSGMGIPFGTKMPTAVYVPTSIPNFPGACSRKTHAPKMPMIRVNRGHAFRRNRGMFTEMPCPRTAVLSHIEYKSVRISSRGSLYVSHYESRAPHGAVQRAKGHTGQDLSSPHGYTLPQGLLLGRDPWHRFCCCISAQDGRDNAVALSHVAPSLHALGGATPRTALAQDRGPHGWNHYSKELNHGEHD